MQDLPINRKTSTGHLVWDGKIVEVFLDGPVVVELEDMKEIMSIRAEMVGDSDFTILVNAKEGASVTKTARKYLADDINPKKIASAFVANSALMVGLVNFYITFNQPARPAKLFSSKDEASNWLLKQLDSQD